METLRARFGPLPVWVWLALITALGLTYYLIQRRKNPAVSTANPSGTGQVPEVVSQETVNVTVPPEGPEPKAPIDKDEEEDEEDTDDRRKRRRHRKPRATHHGQHRHHAPPERHVPPRRVPPPVTRAA